MMKAGWGRLRWKVISKSPFVVTSSRFRYQAFRGFSRSLSLDLPVSRSQVHWTSLAVKGALSCHLTASRPESQPRLVLVPPPGGGEVGDDRFRARLRNVWPERHKIVEYP